MKAIPTTYGGINFRSRLEAKWAAFFDLCEISWEYEPLDLQGWAPDFSLNVAADGQRASALVEVKPVDLSFGDYSEYRKALNHKNSGRFICLLGLSPVPMGDYRTVGAVFGGDGSNTFPYLFGRTADSSKWRTACNTVQWAAPDDRGGWREDVPSQDSRKPARDFRKTRERW